MANCSYLDTSHIPDFVSDRGPSKYFHGRMKIKGNFNHLIQQSSEEDGGSTFLIQDPPGAGKTALLYELKKMAEKREWEVATIGVDALWNPDKLLGSFGDKSKYEGTERTTQVGLKGYLMRAWKNTRPIHSVESILKERDKPLLLILDEAHGLGGDGIPPSEHKAETCAVLEKIHNGKLGGAVILLIAGLGTTIEAMSSLGVSRFKGGCEIELGTLSSKSERAVIRDWLIKDGGAKGDPTQWIDAIAEKTHGWPQHITVYGDAAAWQIQKNKGAMTTAGLEVVYTLGEERRMSYYEQRAEEITRKERRSLARLIGNFATEDGLDKEDIQEFLSQDFGIEKAKDLFHRALEKGVLHRQKGVYTIPIPSMRNWLVSNYSN